MGLSLRLERHALLPSTQDRARELVDAGGDAHGRVVRADAQSAGRGQRARDWTSAPGGSYQTLVAREPDGSPAPRSLAVAVGVAVAETFGRYGAGVRVKWPNDLWLGGRKLGGVLVERHRGHLLLGVGVNVANPVPDGAAALRGWDVDAVSMIVLEGLQEALARLDENAVEADLPARHARVDALAGATVRVRDGETLLEGHAAGVTTDGCLRVRVAPGRVVRSCAGRILEIVGPASG